MSDETTTDAPMSVLDICRALYTLLEDGEWHSVPVSEYGAEYSIAIGKLRDVMCIETGGIYIAPSQVKMKKPELFRAVISRMEQE